MKSINTLKIKKKVSRVAHKYLVKMYIATKFRGKWKCNSSLRYDKFCENTGMDFEEAKIAHLSRPILQITPTEAGFKETIILPNADNEILDSFDYILGQQLVTFDRSVTNALKNDFL